MAAPGLFSCLPGCGLLQRMDSAKVNDKFGVVMSSKGDVLAVGSNTD